MARRKNWSAEEIIAKLRLIEVQLAQGKSLALACKEAEISEQTSRRVPEARDLLQPTRGAGCDRRMAPALQSHPAPLLAWLSASRSRHPAESRNAATHTRRHAVVSHSPVQNPGQVNIWVTAPYG